MMYPYKGIYRCFVCDGERTHRWKGSAWKKPSDNSHGWWPTEPCNHCGGSGKKSPYITLEEYVDRNRAKLLRAKRRIEGELSKLKEAGL